MTTTRDAFEAWAYEIENFSTRFERLQDMSSLAMMRSAWQAATLAEKRQPLTDKQIHERYKAMRTNETRYIDIYRDAEAAHGIKA